MKKIIIVVSKFKFTMSVVILVLLLICVSTLVILEAYNEKNILDGKVIVVDAGHGGVDGGANNRYILEKDINLAVALKLKNKLESNNAIVIMTRIEDVELSKSSKINRSRYIQDLNARVEIINNSAAQMFVSIHTNANRNNPSTRGMIAYYYNSHPHNREIAYIFQNVFNNDEFNYNGKTFKSHHIPQAGKYYILTNAKIPGLLVETGFITNSTDLMLLGKSEYRDYLSETIYQGIVNYFLNIDKLPKEINDTIYIEEEHIINMTIEDMEQ